MSQMQEIRIQLEGVSTVLKTRRFKVPAYQRSYAWEREHVESLLTDINDAIRNKENEYFLGSVVVTGPINQRYEVVDGQQRLTTVSLLIAAIKDIFLRDGDTDVVASVRSEFLASTDRKTKEKESKLVLNEIDNELYQELIDSIPNVEADRFTRQSHKRLLEAARTVFNYIEELCAKSRDAEEDLHAWLDYLETNLKVIVVTAPDDSNAFVIFETLNDRGLELAISDLLKNYLFHKSSDKLEETKNRWLSMVAVLESASDDPLVVTYLRHFAMSRYGLVREKELFGVIKRKVTSKKAALQFSSDLRDTAKTYSALINTDHEYWSKYDAKVRDCAAALNLLGMTQIRPLLLAILERFDAGQVRKAFEKLESVAVRFQIVGGVGGGTLERIYSETAKSVSEGKLTTASDIIKAFTTLPVDSAFEQAFAVATISKQNLARYYLRCLEVGIASTDECEKVPNKDTMRVNLEHVLPLTLGADWQDTWVADDARAYQRRLGNLALMSARINSTVGNEGFSAKKVQYKKSSFHFTKMLSDFFTWDKTSIEERQKQMAKIAVKVWAVK
ncbi:MAG: DUF262 domain-containing HNH endonuclease family protein [Burkholderiales bacterium]|jgi:uncharacterized protein with ParB-like and HNH nuclease domain|uniref:DUF262 domain-containing protein n=1 Tax=Limnobacter sp. TaxID=2003368 RepID=UPI003936AD2D|nr:DUF262 domain-containing HNH endonuclease family protein [Burkholderiales bacterium]